MFLLGSLAVFSITKLLWRFSVSAEWSLTQRSMNCVSLVLDCSFEVPACRSHHHLQNYLPFMKMQLLSKCPSVYRLLTFSLFCSLLPCAARPLPSLCGLSDLPVNLCGYSELCLCYWKHPTNTPISHNVKMIGCALFGYPFPIAGHYWREQPVMKGLLHDIARNKKKRSRRGRE